jgi:hypothetical protein
MRKLFALFCVVSACSLTLAATSPAVTNAYADSKGWVHIITADGRDHTITPRKWQAGGGYDAIEVAQDGRTVGWLAEAMLTPLQGNTSYSYAVALELTIWKAGRVIRRFHPPALVIQNWIFLEGGNDVAFHVAPTHGQEFYDCTLFDVNSGKELAHWALDRKDYTLPDWAEPLLVDDPPPGPAEISNWFPDAPTSTKRDLQSHQK